MCGFPQVLLLGNGLNRAYAGDSWSDLIQKLHSNSKVDLNMIQALPFPLQAVLATDDHVNTATREKQTLFYGVEEIEGLRAPIQALLSTPFDHILTTNYSYEIERVADPRVQRSGQYCKKLMRCLDPDGKAEAKYLLHTYNEVTYQGNRHRVWHIHGEARKPQSIILGHYYYGTLLNRYQKELQEQADQQYRRQKEGKPPLIDSWLDAFIIGDVYILGAGLDFSEMDLWWLLNRKKRERSDHGGVYFYEPREGSEIKAALLEVYGGEFKDLGFERKPSDYKDFYCEAIADIQRCVKAKKTEKAK